MSGEELMKNVASELKEFLSTKNVISEPIDLGDKVVIPVARFGFAFGSGERQGKDGGREGAAGGGGIEPVALVILHKDMKGPQGVQVMSLKKDSAVAQAISALSESLAPQVIEAIKAVSSGKPPAEKSDTP